MSARKIAEKAFEIEVYATMMLALVSEIEELAKEVEDTEDTDTSHSRSSSHIGGWLFRVCDKSRRRIIPLVDNMNQVRSVLDKEGRGQSE